MTIGLQHQQAHDGLTDEQHMLADSVWRYVERGYGHARRDASLGHPHGCVPETWQSFGEFGWLALPVSEAQGGLGGSVVDVCLVAEGLGRAAVNEPFIACALLAGGLLADVADEASTLKWLPGLLDGSRRVALARGAEVLTDGALGGEAALVLGGAGCDGYLVAANSLTNGSAQLLLVAADTPGLTVSTCALYDGQRAAHLRFDHCDPGHPVWKGSAAQRDLLLQRAVDRATVAHCAETVGTMRAAYDITLHYLKTRKQFGRSIASNQVVQHRMVDLLIEIEEARALTFTAADVFDATADAPSSDRTMSSRFTAAAKACSSHAARAVWRETVQLHGAIGMTQEYAVGQLVKRLAAATTLFGSETAQLERLAAMRFPSVERAPGHAIQ